MQPYKFCAVLPKLRFVSLPVMRILLEVGRMWRLVLCIKLAFPLRFVLVVLGLVGLEVLLVYHVGTRSSPGDPSTCVFCSLLLLKIKSANEIQNRKLMSLVFQRSSKSFHEGGSLAMMVPATNLSSNTHLKYSSSLESDCISWVCWTTERSSVIL